MAGVSQRVDDARALAALRLLRDRAEQPSAALNAIGAAMVFSTQRRFEKEQDPQGGSWKPLSPRTAAKRVRGGRRGFAHILRLSNRLMSSVSYDVASDGVEWGSNVAYARIHQLGGTIDMPERQTKLTLRRIRKKGGGFKSRFAKATAKGDLREVTATIGAHSITIPARPYLGVNQADVGEMEQIVIDHLAGEVKP